MNYIKQKYKDKEDKMKELVVLTKHSAGNDTVGDIQTIVRTFTRDTPLGQVYDEMKELGSWDIVIPYNQVKK